MQSRSIKAPTKDERRRMERIVELGCIACRKEGIQQPAEVHHLLDGGVRRGHSFTVALCAWHHRGQLYLMHDTDGMTDNFGPSLFVDSRSFHATYGSDEELLTYQNQQLTEAGK